MIKIWARKKLALSKPMPQAWKREDLPSLYALYHPVVRSISFRFYPNRLVLDDMVQDTFVKIWKNLEHFAGHSHIKTWIIKIAMNTAFDYRKKNLHWHSDLLEEQPALCRTPLEDQISNQNLVEVILEQLPLDQKQVLILFAMEQLSIEEIAQVLKIPSGTVKSRIFHGKINFVNLLKKHGVNL